MYRSNSVPHPNTIPAAEAEKAIAGEVLGVPVAAAPVVMAAIMVVPAVAGDTAPAAAVQVAMATTAAVTVITVAMAAARKFTLPRKAIPTLLKGPAPASPLTARRGQ